jgi:GNAT superfamily N-acetyltransferase
VPLVCDILLDDFICDITATATKISARPQMLSPELVAQVREFLEKFVCRLPFQNLNKTKPVRSRLMQDQFTITLPVTILACREGHLSNLEWFGLMTEYRQTIADAFQRFQKGEIIMLVAEANRFPIGQVWIDLTKQRESAIGILWALRVLPTFQNLGIGTRLIASAERRLKARGFRLSELGVEKDNPRAQRLYERLGYQVVRDHIDEWEYTPPNGAPVHVRSDEWILHKSLVDGGAA